MSIKILRRTAEKKEKINIVIEDVKQLETIKNLFFNLSKKINFQMDLNGNGDFELKDIDSFVVKNTPKKNIKDLVKVKIDGRSNCYIWEKDSSGWLDTYELSSGLKTPGSGWQYLTGYMKADDVEVVIGEFH